MATLGPDDVSAGGSSLEPRYLAAPVGAPEPLADARTRLPRVEFEPGPPGPARLEWSWSPGGDHSPPLGNVFWPFLTLADADDQAILAFAQTYGSLEYPDPRVGPTPSGGFGGFQNRYWESPPNLPGDDASGEDVVWWEPVSAWRFLARRLRARLSLITDLQAGRPTWASDWDQASAVVPTSTPPERLDEAFANPRSGVADVEAATMYDALNDDVGFMDFTDRDKLRRILNDPADPLATTLRPAWGWGGDGRSRIEVALPATRVDATDGSGHRYWLVDGLANALAFAFTVRAHTIKVLRCDECHNPFPIPEGKKKPRYDRRKFCGETCRHEAKKATKRVSGRKAYAKRRSEEVGPST